MDKANKSALGTQCTMSISAGSYIGEVTSDSPYTYPQNGRHSDGYWYIAQ